MHGTKFVLLLEKKRRRTKKTWIILNVLVVVLKNKQNAYLQYRRFKFEVGALCFRSSGPFVIKERSDLYLFFVFH